MKLFTVEQANDLLPEISEKVRRIQKLYALVSEYRDDARSAAAASEFGGGMEGGTEYVKALYDVGKLTTNLAEKGVQLKDHSIGLIDFPSMRDGRVVLLCWKLGEDMAIEWWHDLEGGFAGRKPI